MSRLTQAVVLMLFGGAILRAATTDLYLRYVKEGLQPFLIAAGVLLVSAAVMTIKHALSDAHDSRPDPAHPADGTDAGDHAHHEPWVG